jgi:hypothetical protein
MAAATQPVQALRGVYPLIRRLAQLDPQHSAEALARDVFATFHSLYQMLPRDGQLNLLDARNWPSLGPQPNATLLDRVAMLDLGGADARIGSIAGFGYETPLNIANVEGDFYYRYGAAGDGTVPTARATLAGTEAWYLPRGAQRTAAQPAGARGSAGAAVRGAAAVAGRAARAAGSAADGLRCRPARTVPAQDRLVAAGCQCAPAFPGLAERIPALRRMSTALVWFRQDLRLADNPALRAAVASARHVVPVYVWSPEEEGAWAPGGAARWWLHDSLRSLEARLRERGSRLVITRGPTCDALLALAKATGATQILWNRRYEPAAMAVEKALEQRLVTDGMIGLAFHSSRLAPPDAVRSGAGTPYQVFTPFWRAFLQQVNIDAPEASPRELPAPPRWPESVGIDALRLLSPPDWHLSLAEHWQPGEDGARAALKTFVSDRLARYAQDRDRPDLNANSRLSPFLRHGELSPRQVWTAAMKAGERAGLAADAVRGDRFCAELIWREFATQQLVLHPSLPDRARTPRFDQMPWRHEPGSAGAPASRSSMPACASCGPPAGCTTACA